MIAILSHKMILKGLFVAIIGAALGLGGPYGTYEVLPVLPRVLYWMAVLFIPWLLWESLFAFASNLLPPQLKPRILMALLMPAFAVLGSIFVTVLGLQIGILEPGSFLQEWPLSIVTWLAFSFIIVLPLILIGDELSKRHYNDGGSDLLSFLTEKLPLKLRGAELIALKSEDHYLRVYTTEGDDLILMSMENAMTALGGYPGVRTHRSWWVALDQLPSASPKKKLTSEVQLRSGLKVPISRRRLKTVLSTLETRSEN